VKLSFLPLAFLLYLCRPRVVIDGVEHRRYWGTHEFPLAPGPHRIEISFRYLFMSRCGLNSVSFELRPGETLHIKYYMPPWMFSRGSITVGSNIGEPILTERSPGYVGVAGQGAGATSHAAIWSMILGIVSVALCAGALAGIPAVILGHIGMSATKGPAAKSGRGMAIAGLATGYIGIGVTALFILVQALSL